jgi:hypothetical protein
MVMNGTLLTAVHPQPADPPLTVILELVAAAATVRACGAVVTAHTLTVVVVVLVLLAGTGSGGAAATVAVLVRTVPSVVPLATTADTAIVAVSPDAMVAFEHETVPVAPTAGAVQVQPAGALTLVKSTAAGSGSVTTTVAAGTGPVLVTANAYCRLLPAATGSGASVLVIWRSARFVSVA